MRRFHALGVDFFVGDERAAAEAIIERARSGAGGYGCFCSVHPLIQARHDWRLRQAFEDAWIVFPDGLPVVWLGHRIGCPEAARACGIDVMPLVIDLGRRFELRHYFFGSTPTVLAALERRLVSKYPGARIVGSLSPPFAPLEDLGRTQLLQEIQRAEPNVVWCGLGAPKQDLWMHRYAGRFGNAVVLGVGAAFDLVAGTKPRAPLWMQQSGLEWLHRLLHEPGRLARRYLRANTEFAVRAVVEISTRRRSSRGFHGPS